MKWSSTLAVAMYERDRLKEKIDIRRSKIDHKIRANPDLYFESDKKPTEASITATINQNETIITMNEDLAKKNFNVNILSGVKVALEHKKKMLEIEANLYLNGYFSNPKVSGKLAEDDKKKVDEAVTGSLKKNPRMLKRSKKKED